MTPEQVKSIWDLESEIARPYEGTTPYEYFTALADLVQRVTIRTLAEATTLVVATERMVTAPTPVFSEASVPYSQVFGDAEAQPTPVYAEIDGQQVRIADLLVAYEVLSRDVAWGVAYDVVRLWPELSAIMEPRQVCPNGDCDRTIPADANYCPGCGHRT